MAQNTQNLKNAVFSLEWRNKSFDLRFGDKALACQIGLHIGGDGWGAAVFRDSPPEILKSQGEDAAGAYSEISLISRFQGRETDEMEARKSPAYAAGLRFRFYAERQAAVCTLIYEGKQALSAKGAARVSLPLLYGFEAGLSACRSNPWWTHPQFLSSPKQLSGPSQQLLWKRGSNDYALMLPLGGSGAKASLSAHGGDFGLDLASNCEGFKAAETPLFIITAGQDPYALSQGAADLASIAMSGSFKPRRQKPFPKVFEGIGWCSWNTYYYDVDHEKLLASARSFAEAKFPVRYMLIDDGWSTLKLDPGKMSPDKPWPGTAGMLWDYKADPKKFPKGLSGIKEELTKLCGVQEMGVWHAFLGYWSYIHPESPIAASLGDALMPASRGGLVPNPAKAKKFYEAWYKYMAAEGVSFIKVDDQSSVQFAYDGLLPLQDAGRGVSHGQQDAAEGQFGNAVINCMAMSWENVSNLKTGNVSRSSNDYMPMIPDNGPQHLSNNIYSSFWISGFTTPDFDMFESHHSEGESHALLRAISGGPVYFTDKPGREDWGLLRKLITADGTLLRAENPAQPCRDMLFSDPLEKALPLKAYTHAGHVGLVAAFNVFRGHEPVRGKVSASDVEGLEAGEHLIYEHFSGQAAILSRGQSLDFELAPAAKALYTSAPINSSEGFAVVGLLDKFLSSKAVSGIEFSRKGARLLLRESGRLGFYSRRTVTAVVMGGINAEFRQGKDGWVEVSAMALPSGTCDVEITFGNEA